MSLLSLSEIDNICRRPAGLSHNLWTGWAPVTNILDSNLRDLFLNLYNTGLRFNELKDLSKWNINIDDDFICSLSKGSNDRTFTPSELTTLLKTPIENQTEIYPSCRYSTANYYLQRAFAPYVPTVENKNITTHIFRHRFIKQLYADGYTVAQIQSITGEVDSKNIQIYIDSEIYI